MGISDDEYEQKKPKFSERTRYLFNCFNLLNRRRIEHNPLQKSDILEELGDIKYSDKALWIIETLDSNWLEREADRIRRMNKLK